MIPTFQFTRIQTIIVCGLTDVIPMAFSLYLISYIRDLNTAIITTDAKLRKKQLLRGAEAGNKPTGATTEQILYFLCSFTFLLSRALLMSLLAARVHTEAKKPLLILFDVSTQEDSKEVQRFRLQMMYNPIALTGSLFSITRSTILKFFSTIMTYELVLLQLNENQKDTTTVGHLNETLHLP
ncbi:gustatory receptor for sugar taste 64e-like [Ostrinia nubilalis]|uniref:gustatory receptor for sugar taste 64e-like n=1 Tax=Ostrinia nubilalis TaxID=29057 RepID=UPI003082252F